MRTIRGRSMKRTCVSLLTSFALTLALCGGFAVIEGYAAKLKPVVIGGIEPLSGVSEAEGVDKYRGAEIAKEEINSLPSKVLNGRPLEIRWNDSEGKPDKAVECAHKLVNVNDVSVIVGTHPSTSALAVGPYLERKGVIFICGTPSNPKIREIGPHTFSLVPLDDLVGKDTARFAIKDSGQKNFSLLFPDNAWGQGAAKWVKFETEKLGGKILEEVFYPRFKTDYRAQIRRLHESKPPAVIYGAYGQEVTRIFKQMSEMGKWNPQKTPWYAVYIKMSSFEAPGETAWGVKGIDYALTSPRHKTFAEKYEKKYGEPPRTTYAQVDYDMVWIAALAIKSAGTTDPAVLKDILPRVSQFYLGASGDGDKRMDKDGMQKRGGLQGFILDKGKYVVSPTTWIHASYK